MTFILICCLNYWVERALCLFPLGTSFYSNNLSRKISLPDLGNITVGITICLTIMEGPFNMVIDMHMEIYHILDHLKIGQRFKFIIYSEYDIHLEPTRGVSPTYIHAFNNFLSITILSNSLHMTVKNILL